MKQRNPWGCFLGLIMAAGWMLPSNLSAETFYLNDGSVFEGNLIHYYQDSVEIILASGDHLVISRHELDKIVFPKPKTSKITPQTKPNAKAANDIKNKPSQTILPVSKKDAPFLNPTSTFEYWRKQLRKGNLQGMARCFMRSAEPLMLAKLKQISKRERRKMVRQAKKTRFVVEKPIIQGDQARLQIAKIYKGKTAIDTIGFVREDNLWKMVPK